MEILLLVIAALAAWIGVNVSRSAWTDTEATTGTILILVGVVFTCGAIAVAVTS